MNIACALLILGCAYFLDRHGKLWTVTRALLWVAAAVVLIWGGIIGWFWVQEWRSERSIAQTRRAHVRACVERVVKTIGATNEDYVRQSFAHDCEQDPDFTITVDHDPFKALGAVPAPPPGSLHWVPAPPEKP